MNVLFVCTGNICRSPMAAGLFAAHALRHGLPCTVRSAGLLAEGEPAASGAIDVLAARGVDLARHRSTTMTPTMIDGADLVLTMERRHVRCVVARRPDAFSRTFTLPDLVARSRRRGGPLEGDSTTDWLGRMHEGRSAHALLQPDPTDEIDDPLGGGAEQFEDTARRLDALVSSLIGTMAMLPVRPLPVGALATT